MPDYPVFKNYVYWHASPNNPENEYVPLNNEPHIRKWLIEKGLVHVVKIDGGINADTRDIGELTTGPWSAYTSRDKNNTGYYFFQYEEDAVAFKLKWL